MTTRQPSTPINESYMQAWLDLINNSPFPQHLRMRIDEIAEDRSRISLDADGRHLQPYNIIHGGVLATLIDTATFWAVFYRLPEDAGLVNVDLKLNYLQSATVGRLRAEGRCIRPGRTISYAEAYVYDEADTLLAHGTSTLMALPGKGIDIGVRKFASD
ncbi:MAG: PaaI family thioesterase [Chloroflexota bacterium]